MWRTQCNQSLGGDWEFTKRQNIPLRDTIKVGIKKKTDVCACTHTQYSLLNLLLERYKVKLCYQLPVKYVCFCLFILSAAWMLGHRIRLFFNAEHQIVIHPHSPGLYMLRCDLPLNPHNPEWCNVMLVLSSRYHGVKFTPCLRSSRVYGSKSSGLTAQTLGVSAACQGCDRQATFCSCEGHCIT